LKNMEAGYSFPSFFWAFMVLLISYILMGENQRHPEAVARFKKFLRSWLAWISRRLIAWWYPKSEASFLVKNQYIFSRKKLGQRFGPVVRRKAGVVVTLLGLPGAGKSSTVNALVEPARQEEGTGTSEPVGTLGRYVTPLASEHPVYLHDKRPELINPRTQDLVGLEPTLLDKEETFLKVLKTVLTILKGDEALTKDDYRFLLQLDSQPETVGTIFEEIRQDPPKLSKSSVAVFVISCTEAPHPKLLEIAQGCRTAGIPVVIICTKVDLLKTEQEGEKFVNDLKSYTDKVHLLDARPGATDHDQIRAIWFSILSACYSDC